MLAITNVDVFTLINSLMQRYPRTKQPKVYYGLSNFLAMADQSKADRHHAIVLDAEMMFMGVTPEPIRPVDTAGVIDWDIVDEYLETPAKRLAVYSYTRPNIIEEMLRKAGEDDKHSLSAMASNFTPAIRPQVKAKIIDFLRDPKTKRFVLPIELQPKRGRAVAYYQAATDADFSELKADILRDAPQTYAGRYWKKVIAKEGK